MPAFLHDRLPHMYLQLRRDVRETWRSRSPLDIIQRPGKTLNERYLCYRCHDILDFAVEGRPKI
eukprot:8123109-Pyramimonas_sp.AAC.1